MWSRRSIHSLSRVSLSLSLSSRLITRAIFPYHCTSHPFSTIQHAAPIPPGSTPLISSTPRHDTYDIVIVGGGMVGATLACALASSPITRQLRVAVLESAPPKMDTTLPAAPSIRVSSITPQSVAIFERLGVWNWMKQQRVTPFTEMQVWHTFTRGRIHWTAAEMDRSELGFVVENDVIQSALFQRLRQLAGEQDNGLDVIAPCKVESITQRSVEDSRGGPDWLTIQLATPSHSHLSSSSHRSPSLSSPSSSSSSSSSSSPSSDSSATTSALLNPLPPPIPANPSITCRLLIGADGPGSLVKRFMAADAFGWDYQQRGVVATVRTSGANKTAWQRFLPEGPVAFLPCHSEYSNIVWSTTPAHAKHLCSVPNEQFLSDLNAAFRAPPAEFQPAGQPSFFENLLPSQFSSLLPILFPDPPETVPPMAIEVCGPRAFFPLRAVHTTNYIKHRVALIGDAAHVIHPLAGQGVNLGFGDAAELARVIEYGVQNGSELGDTVLLDRYQRVRVAENLKMMGAIDSIGKIFRVNNGPFALARGIGLDLFNAVPAIKKQASMYAMGWDSDSNSSRSNH